MTSAWYDITCRLQSNTVHLARRAENGRSWLGRMRTAVNRQGSKGWGTYFSSIRTARRCHVNMKLGLPMRGFNSMSRMASRADPRLTCQELHTNDCFSSRRTLQPLLTPALMWRLSIFAPCDNYPCHKGSGLLLWTSDQVGLEHWHAVNNIFTTEANLDPSVMDRYFSTQAFIVSWRAFVYPGANLMDDKYGAKDWSFRRLNLHVLLAHVYPSVMDWRRSKDAAVSGGLVQGG